MGENMEEGGGGEDNDAEFYKQKALVSYLKVFFSIQLSNGYNSLN